MVSQWLGRLFIRQSGRGHAYKAKCAARQRRLTLEPLESRQLLTLLGVVPNFPKAAFDATGTFNYAGPSASSTPPLAANEFKITGTPLAFQLNSSTAPVAITADPTTGLRSVLVDILVNSSGNLIGSAESPNDIDLYGKVIVNSTTYSGELLKGKILQFGWQYNVGTSTSQFDFRFQLTGGLLAQGTSPLYPAGDDIGLTVASENSSSFTGNFNVPFNGGAKGTLGPISPLPTAIYGYKFNDVNDSGVDNSDPRLNSWTINVSGTNYLGNPVSLTTTTQTSTVNGHVGEYSFTGLLPGTYTVTETQQTGWVQTTGGTTITLTSGQVADAYAGEAGSLPSGGSEIVSPLLAFGNFKPTAIVIGMDKSPATPKTVTTVSPVTGAVSPNVITPYGDSFLGGVRVATGDVSGTGFDDIVTAPGRGGQPIIKVYDQAGNLLTSFQAYPSSVNGGLQVAVADLNGDGLADIVTVPSWGPAEVRVFLNTGAVGAPHFSSTPSMDFLAFPSSFIGGAVVAASSEGTTPDHTPQIIVGSGAGMKATVKVFDFSTTAPTSPPLVASFTPFSNITPALQGGVSLSVAQLTSDPTQSIVVGAGEAGQSLVNIWGWNSSTSGYTPLSAPGVIGFPAFTGPSSNAPIEVATLNNAQGIATAIVAVQNAGGATNQVSQLNITSVSPLVLSAPLAIPGSFPGPDTIATINNVLPGTISLATAAKLNAVPKPTTSLAKPVATTASTATTAATSTSSSKSSATATTTAAKPVATTASTTTTTAASSTTSAKPTSTATTTTTAAKPSASAAAVVSTTSSKTTTTASASISAAFFAMLGKS